MIAVTFAWVAKRASEAIRLGGMRAAIGITMPKSRISWSRKSACISAGALIRVGAERSLSVMSHDNLKLASQNILSETVSIFKEHAILLSSNIAITINQYINFVLSVV